jgi:hypothetical protein
MHWTSGVHFGMQREYVVGWADLGGSALLRLQLLAAAVEAHVAGGGLPK